MKRRHTNLATTVTTALLAALIIIFAFTPIGFINVGVVYITFLCIPVLIGTFAIGRNAGLILSVCMGGMSLLTALTKPSALVAPILAQNAVWVIFLCLIPRLLVPLVADGIYLLMKKRNERAAVPMASVFGSLTNTVFFLGFLLAFYYLLGIEEPTLLATIGTISLTAGIPEAITAGLVCTPILIALRKGGQVVRKDK